MGSDQVDHGAPDDPQRMGFLEAEFAQVVLADVLDVPGGGVEPQPSLPVDVGDPQRPLHVEDVGVRIGHGHHHLAQASVACVARHALVSPVTSPNGSRYCHSRRSANNAKRAFARVVTLVDVAKTFVGSRVRQLRSERGFSQAALAQMLEISPSYLNQIEHDVRPLTVAVLLRITEVFGVDATFFASQDDTRLVAELREVTMDRDLGIDVDLAEVADMVSAHPDPGARDGQPASALPDHHHAAGRRHRGPVLRRQRQRVDHDAARGGARLLLPAAELSARAGHRRRGSHRPDARCTAAIWPASWPTG